MGIAHRDCSEYYVCGIAKVLGLSSFYIGEGSATMTRDGDTLALATLGRATEIEMQDHLHWRDFTGNFALSLPV
jgi:hypothetical protein